MNARDCVTCFSAGRTPAESASARQPTLEEHGPPRRHQPSVLNASLGTTLANDRTGLMLPSREPRCPALIPPIDWGFGVAMADQE